MEDNNIQAKTRGQFKAIVKKHVRSAAFKSLLDIKSGHTKGNSIKYPSFNIQPYLEDSSMSHEERTTLFNLSAETINGFKAHFCSAFLQDSKCRLGC